MINEQETIELHEQIYLDNAYVQEAQIPQVRHLPFSGAKNFRDLGGYQTMDGRTVRWGLLYRSDCLHKLSDADVENLSALCLHRIVDFRADYEKQSEPDRLPADLAGHLVEIPILDNSARDEFVKNLKETDTVRYMIETNRELATRFMPEMRKFIDVLLTSNGKPVLFHCAAGKDRTGFASAITLRMLGVPQDVVMQDYLLSNDYFLASYRWQLSLWRFFKGNQFVDAATGMMRAHPSYLSAAFQTIDGRHGSFENYVHTGLGLTSQDVQDLKSLYLD